MGHILANYFCENELLTHIALTNKQIIVPANHILEVACKYINFHIRIDMLCRVVLYIAS